MSEQNSKKKNTDKDKRPDKEMDALRDLLNSTEADVDKETESANKKKAGSHNRHTDEKKDTSIEKLLSTLDKEEEEIDAKPKVPVKGPTDIEKLLSTLEKEEEPDSLDELLASTRTKKDDSNDESDSSDKKKNEATVKIPAAPAAPRVHVSKRVEPQGKRGKPAKKFSFKTLIIVLIVLLVAGVGVYALVHYAIMPSLNPTPSSPPKPSVHQTVSSDATTAKADATKETKASTADEKAPESKYEIMADKKLKDMSTREKICQLFIAHQHR